MSQTGVMTDAPDRASALTDAAARKARLVAQLATRLAAALPDLAAMQTKCRVRCAGGLAAAVLVLVGSLAVEAIGLASFAFVGNRPAIHENSDCPMMASASTDRTVDLGSLGPVGWSVTVPRFFPLATVFGLIP
jgi:hypothetical protein